MKESVMAMPVPFGDLFPKQRMQFLRDFPVDHTHRILRKNGGRLVESAFKNQVVYAMGIHVFTLHRVAPETIGPDEPEHDQPYVLADAHGWAFSLKRIQELINDSVMLPVSES